MEDLDPKKSLPARYPNFKKSDKKHEIKVFYYLIFYKIYPLYILSII